MGRLTAALYDRFTRGSEVACLRDWRAALLRNVNGEVLEVGAGTGLNLPFYPPGLTRLVLSEPDPHMRHELAKKVRASDATRVELLHASLGDLQVPAESFDVVVGTLVLCSVPRLDAALAEIRRVLRPHGRFVFLEHVAAENRPRRLRWQRRVDPIWTRLSGGCHLARSTGQAIVTAGFAITDMRRESMRKAWPLVRPTIRGVAVKV